jgi:hypothetical protein
MPDEPFGPYPVERTTDPDVGRRSPAPAVYLGRFAAAYRQKFGQQPSETLRTLARSIPSLERSRPTTARAHSGINTPTFPKSPQAIG